MSTPTEKLAADCKTLASDAQQLIKATASQAGDKLAEVKDSIQASLGTLQPRFAQAQAAVRENADAAKALAHDYVRAKPWHAVGIAAATGLVIGLLIGRR